MSHPAARPAPMNAPQVQELSASPVVLGGLVLGAILLLWLAMKVTKVLFKILFYLILLAVVAAAVWHFFLRSP